jgi:hypothetical protein
MEVRQSSSSAPQASGGASASSPSSSATSEASGGARRSVAAALFRPLRQAGPYYSLPRKSLLMPVWSRARSATAQPPPQAVAAGAQVDARTEQARAAGAAAAGFLSERPSSSGNLKNGIATGGGAIGKNAATHVMFPLMPIAGPAVALAKAMILAAEMADAGNKFTRRAYGAADKHRFKPPGVAACELRFNPAQRAEKSDASRSNAPADFKAILMQARSNVSSWIKQGRNPDGRV